MVYPLLQTVVQRKDSTTWYKDEFHGRLLQATRTYTSWDKQTMKVCKYFVSLYWSMFFICHFLLVVHPW